MYTPSSYEMLPSGGRTISTAPRSREGSAAATQGVLILSFSLSILGAGVLTLPSATYQASIGMTIILLILMVPLLLYTAYLLSVGCLLADSAAYKDVVAFTCFGPIDEEREHAVAVEDETLVRKYDRLKTWRMVFAFFVDTVIMLNVFGTLVFYAHVIATQLAEVVVGFGARGYWTTPAPYYYIAFGFFFLLGCLRNVEELAWSTALGVAAIVGIVAVIAASYFETGSVGIVSAEARGAVRWFSVEPSLLLALPVFTVAYSFHMNVPPFFVEMKQKEPLQLCTAALWGLTISCVAYILVGVCGYLTFGESIGAGGGDVLRRYPTDWLWTGMRCWLVLQLTTAFPVVGIPVRQFMHRMYLHIRGRHEEAHAPEMYQDAPRIAIACESLLLTGAVVVVAKSIPNVFVLAAFIGAAVEVPTCIGFPAMVGCAIYSGRWAESKLAKETDMTELCQPSSAKKWACVVLFVASIALTVLSLLDQLGATPPTV